MPQDLKAGYAINGYRLSMPLTYSLWKNFGVAAFLFSQKHDIDKVKILHQLPISSKDILNSSPWNFKGFLAGPFTSLALDGQDKTFLNIKVTGGLIHAELPVMGKYLYYYDPALSSTRYFLVTTGQADDIAFAFLIETGVQINTSKHIAITAGLNY